MTKYYFAGATRIAMRKYTIPQPMTVEYFLGDHPSLSLTTSLGSTSITTDANGAKVSEMRYKPCPLRYPPGVLREGEVRSWWTASLSTMPAYKLADYTFTGQFSYMDDPSTSSVTEGFGLMFYNARWYDPALGRFAQADTIIPPGVQGLDRYAYVNNSPLNYVDPSGHTATEGDGSNTSTNSDDWPPENIKRVMSLLGLSYYDYLVWSDENRELATILLNAEPGDIVRFSLENEHGNPTYENYMIVTDEDGYAFYDIANRERVESTPSMADALAQNITGAAVYSQHEDGTYTADLWTDGFDNTLPVYLPDDWNIGSDGRGGVVMVSRPDTWEAIGALGTLTPLLGVPAVNVWAALGIVAGSGVLYVSAIMSADQIPYYYDVLPRR